MLATRSRPAVRSTWLVAAVVVVGAGALALTTLGSGAGDHVDQSGYAPSITLVGVAPGSPVATGEASVEVQPAAPNATEAVTRYLDAEIAGDYATSFSQLSADDRQGFATLDDWEVEADNRPRILGYRIVDVDGDTARADVELLAFVSEINGVSPASATIDFAIEQQDGGSRLSLIDSTFTPHYPGQDLAMPAAIAWVEAAQRCEDEDRERLEYDGNLLGTLGLAESICGAAGTATASVGRLDSLPDPSAVLNGFGEQAAQWSRVVAIQNVAGASPLHVVLAPLGDQWVVIGAVSA
jgi:hypothetical protein